MDESAVVIDGATRQHCRHNPGKVVRLLKAGRCQIRRRDGLIGGAVA